MSDAPAHQEPGFLQPEDRLQVLLFRDGRVVMRHASHRNEQQARAAWVQTDSYANS